MTKSGNSSKITREDSQKAKDDLGKQISIDSVGRYKFLLGQTDLFSHFIKSKGIPLHYPREL